VIACPSHILVGATNRRIEKPFDLKEVRRLVNELIR
jgi:hypothetical protein